MKTTVELKSRSNCKNIDIKSSIFSFGLNVKLTVPFLQATISNTGVILGKRAKTPKHDGFKW